MNKKENLDKYEHYLFLCNESAMYPAAVIPAIWKVVIAELKLPVSLGTRDPELILRKKMDEIRHNQDMVNDGDRYKMSFGAFRGGSKVFSNDEIILFIDVLSQIATSQTREGVTLLQMHLGNRKVITSMKAKIQPNPKSV